MDDSPEARRRGWRLMGKALRPYRRQVVLAALAGLVWTAAKVSIPTLAKAAIDQGVIGGRHNALLHWGLIIVAVGSVQAVCTGTRRYLAVGMAARVETDLRQELFAHLVRMPFSYHDRAQTGQLMARATGDLQQVQFFLVFIPLAIANTLTVAAVAVILLLANPLLAVLALGPLPLLNGAAKRFSNRLHPEVMGLQQELAELSTVVEETVSGIRVVKGFGAEPLQSRRLSRQAGAVYGVSLRAARVRSRFLPVLDLLPALGLVMVLWYGGHQVLAGHLTIGGLTAFNLYVYMLIWPLRMTGMLVAQAQRSAAAAQRVEEILSTAPTVVDRPGAQPLPPGGGEVRFEDVAFSYESGGQRLRILDGLDLVVPAGEAVAIVGPTGCGKTTLARLIPRYYDVDGGRVLVDGLDVRELRLDHLRRSVGVVFEDTFLFSDTVRANIAFADPSASAEDVERAARLAGAHEFVMELPQAYNTPIGEHGFSLSGGQRQRLAIARAILADPRVLVLDDATSSVDPTKEHEIRAALLDVMRNRTTIVISHRPATIALADRVVLLDERRIAAEGSHGELLATCPRYREVLARAAAEDAVADTTEVVA